VPELREGEAMSTNYRRCGKCRLYIDHDGKSRFVRVCRCAGAPNVSAQTVIRALLKFDKRPLWQRALERREREKHEQSMGRRRVVELTPSREASPPPPSAPRLSASLGDIAKRHG
jgi:hypothetical protein